MTILHTSAQCRQLDRLMIEQQGVSGFALMRRAGQAAFDALIHRWPGAGAITIFCGKGNNAGDGYIIAGLARQIGLDAQVLQVGGGALKGDAALAQSWATDRGVTASDKGEEIRGAVIVDALLGTGLSGPLRPPFGEAVARINRANRPVLAVDVPSGVDADTGAAADQAVAADITVSFIGAKLGLHTGQGLARRGELVQAGLGVSDAVLAQVPGCPLLEYSSAALPALAVNQHKHRQGHLLVVGGDLGMGGAPLLAAEAALRIGTGLVTVLTRPQHHAAMLARRPELMLRDGGDLESGKDLLSRASAVVLGPGLGREPWGEKLFQLALQAGKPTVVDADGLRWLAQITNEGRDAQQGGNFAGAAAKGSPQTGGLPKVSPAAAGAALGKLVITPHPGEAAQLLGVGTQEVEGNRPGAAQRLADRFAGIAVLKGAGTVCAAPGDGLLGVCAHGNPGMATAGMGDALAGVLGGLLAQGLEAAEAVRIGVCLHSAAADLVAKRQGRRSLLATDVINAIGELAP